MKLDYLNALKLLERAKEALAEFTAMTAVQKLEQVAMAVQSIKQQEVTGLSVMDIDTALTTLENARVTALASIDGARKTARNKVQEQLERTEMISFINGTAPYPKPSILE
jgi:hypothetical protein